MKKIERKLPKIDKTIRVRDWLVVMVLIVTCTLFIEVICALDWFCWDDLHNLMDIFLRFIPCPIDNMILAFMFSAVVGWIWYTYRRYNETSSLKTTLEESLEQMFVIEEGHIQTIKERKQAEESMNQYAHIVSSSTDMLALLDNRYNYIAANKVYIETFNLTSEQLIGNTVSNVFGEEFFNTVIKENADRCLGGEEVNYQDWFDFPSGKKYMDITYYPYTDTENQVRGFVVNGRDSTNRKELEDELVKKNIELALSLSESKLMVKVLDDQNQKLEKLSTTDHLTGLNNMRNFIELLGKETERSFRYNHNLTVLLMDINNFKLFNDTYGHLEGDSVLVCLGDVISKQLRKHDVSCRYGGDEFVVFLPETNKKKGQEVAERIKNEFDKTCFGGDRERKIGDPTVSIGVVEHQYGQTAKTILKLADNAMYDSKGKDKEVADDED